MNLHQRIRAAREKAGLSMYAAAGRLGVSQTAVAGWEKDPGGTVPRLARIKDIAAAYGVEADWLLTGNNANLDLGGKYVFIRRYTPPTDQGSTDLASHASVARFADDSDTYAYRIDWLNKKGLRADALTVVLATDDLMGPVISAEDPLLVNTADTALADGGIYAFAHAGQAIVRRCFRRLDGQIVLHVDSGARPDEVVAESLLNTIGRVVTASISL